MTIKQLLLISGLTLFYSANLWSQQGISQDEKNEASFIEASMLLVLDKYEEANETFLKLLKEDKENATLNFQISRTYLGLENKNEGIEYARKAVLYDSQNSFFFEHLIDLLLEEGMMSEAIVYAKKLYLLEPQNELYFNHWIAILAHQEKYDLTVNALQERIDTYGASPDLMLKLAGIHMKMGKSKKTEQILKTALEDFPRESEIHLQLIAFYVDRNDSEKVKKGIDQFNSTFPGEKNSLLEISGLGKYLKPNDMTQGNPLYATIESDQLSLDQKIKELIPFLTEFVNNDNQESKRILLEAIPLLEKRYPSEAKVQSIKGDIYFYSSEYKEAIKAYENCLKSKKNLLVVWEHMLYAYHNDGQSKNLLERSENALLYFPNQSVIWYYYCLGLVENYKYDDALYEIDSYRYLTTNNLQQNINAKLLSARCHLGNKQLDKGLEVLDQAKAEEKKAGISPNKGNPYIDLYRLLILSEDPAKEAEAQNLSIKLERLNTLPLYQYAKAKCLSQSNKFEAALKAIDRAIDGTYPNPADFYELKGDILFALENTAAAKASYLLAIEKNGNLNKINSKLNRLN